MKKTFSFLLIATFAAYAVFLQLNSQPSAAVPISLVAKTNQANNNADVALNNKTSSSTAPVAPTAQPPAAAATSGAAKPVAAASPAPAPAPKPAPAPVVAAKPKGQYRDGTYTGDSVDAYYGNVQVAAVIANGKLADVKILDYPQDRRTSQYINGQALPILVSEAVSAQSGNVDAVSGASETSPAFVRSLNSALAQAKN